MIASAMYIRVSIEGMVVGDEMRKAGNVKEEEEEEEELVLEVS